jgi:hypothetical protein
MEMTMSNTKQIETARRVLKAVATAKSIRNPVVGKAHERLYRIDAATMRRIRKLVG